MHDVKFAEDLLPHRRFCINEYDLDTNMKVEKG